MRSAHVLLACACLLTCTLSGPGADPPRRAGALPGETFTPPARGERQADRLRAGDPAPDFSLPAAAGKAEVRLSSFRGKRPVVLIFGSCT